MLLGMVAMILAMLHLRRWESLLELRTENTVLGSTELDYSKCHPENTENAFCWIGDVYAISATLFFII